MIYDSITGFHRFSKHFRTLLSVISCKPIEKTKKISKTKVQEDIISKHIVTKGLTKNFDNFLTTKKMSKNKRWLANVLKRKLNMRKQKSKNIAMNCLDNLSIKSYQSQYWLQYLEKIWKILP